MVSGVRVLVIDTKYSPSVVVRLTVDTKYHLFDNASSHSYNVYTPLRLIYSDNNFHIELAWIDKQNYKIILISLRLKNKFFYTT